MDKIQKLQQIVENKQYAIVDNVVVDGITAQLIIQVYDSLSEENKKKLIKLSIEQMAKVCWKLIK